MQHIKIEKRYPILFAMMCQVVSPRVAKRQLRKAHKEFGEYNGKTNFRGIFDEGEIIGSFSWRESLKVASIG